ncbi:hypothetical protein J4729_07470 [Leisingera sp. HS039]|uniref:hypothetical protein n=1 Tax=Leisingera sp. HS039 TaxID=2818496 RepID=UPI001B39F95A|nr:hypothetical protein [Leisingera sp. HS039]MBQ4824388.1 hypothetical protein [Leisingera sp. HS039]
MNHVAARRIAERVNIAIITNRAQRRALVGVGSGERATPGPARAAAELCEAKGSAPAPTTYGGAEEAFELVPPGVQATRQRMPALLRRMDEQDARRAAAGAYVHAIEKVGSVAGASAEGGKADGGPATNDGGVTTRIRHAGTISTVQGALDRAGVALKPNAQGGGARKPITARALMDAICLDGADMKAVLQGAGWSGHRRDVAKLNVLADVYLELMARVLGLVATDAPTPWDA